MACKLTVWGDSAFKHLKALHASPKLRVGELLLALPLISGTSASADAETFSNKEMRISSSEKMKTSENAIIGMKVKSAASIVGVNFPTPLGHGEDALLATIV